MEDKFSICIVSWNNIFDLSRLLASIDNNTVVKHEVCIIDNGSDKITTDFLENYRGKHNDKVVKLHKNKKNLGIGTARNQAMKIAEGNFIAICDSDVVVAREWLKDMHEVYKKDVYNIGAVGTASTMGRQMNERGYWETDFMTSCCMLIPRATIDSIKLKFLAEKENLLKRVEREKTKEPKPYDNYSKHVEGIQRYIEYESGYWDPSFPYGADDFDFSLLIRWTGLRLAIADLVPLSHKHASRHPALAEHRDKCVREGFQYYRSKWSLIEDYYGEWDSQLWDCVPTNKEYRARWDSLIKK